LFRFYEELNDYLPEKARKRELCFDLKEPTTVGEAIAALGIPSGEVDLILVNGESVGFEHRLRDGDRVSVYPIFERFDISGVTQVREKPLIKLRSPGR
jgi:hypothetical protein